MEIYQMPPEKKEPCTCKGSPRRDGRNILTAIVTSNDYGRDVILEALDGLVENYCEVCQSNFKAGFFEEKQRREEIAYLRGRKEVANG